MDMKRKRKELRKGFAFHKNWSTPMMKYFNGIYLITPFLKYEITEHLVKYVREKQEVKEGIN